MIANPGKNIVYCVNVVSIEAILQLFMPPCNVILNSLTMEGPVFQRESIRGRFNLGVIISACMVIVWFSVIAGFLGSDLQAAETALKITRITPSGVDVPPGRQIVFEFDRPVVPLGRMERSDSEIPVSIEPALSCQWRWLNSSNLACQLDEQHAMAPSTRYNITVRPEITI